MIGLRFHFDPVTLPAGGGSAPAARAWWSLWLLALLFSVSLAAELICNDRPLYMRLNGQSYFPVLRFYPADTFYRNGK
jgi:microcin C transport system permease protein